MCVCVCVSVRVCVAYIHEVAEVYHEVVAVDSLVCGIPDTSRFITLNM